MSLLSPGVLAREIDFSTALAAVDGSTAGTVGTFTWGPAKQRVLISNEDQLLKVFGKPTADNAPFWFSAASFLAYSNSLYVVRAAGDGFLNAVSKVGDEVDPVVGVQIANDDVWEVEFSNGLGDIGPFAARYAGALGNGIRVSVADASTFEGWDFADLFDAAPATSQYALSRGGSNDEMHIVVVDQFGGFTGIPGTILETYAFVSKGSDTKSADGASSFYKTVLTQNSAYIYWTGHLVATSIGKSVIGTAFGDLTTVYDTTLAGGADDFDALDDGELMFAWDQFRSAEDVDVSILFTGPSSVTVSQYVIDNIAESRRDLIVTVSPQLADVRGTGVVDKVIAAKNDPSTGINRSTSYASFTCNWKMMFDRYNEQNVWVPDNADVAGTFARTDATRDTWWSPAGYERGGLKNVVKLAWAPNGPERDQLYKNGVNPVLNIAGQGPLLFGDKTMLTRPSAFDRINVRRLFLTLEKTISNSAKYSLFQFNDEFTRAQFRNLITPFLRDVQAKRGIYDFRVICDETNNTPTVIDGNEFVGTIMVQPAKSINFITLNFVATRTGVEFSEIVV